MQNKSDPTPEFNDALHSRVMRVRAASMDVFFDQMAVENGAPKDAEGKPIGPTRMPQLGEAMRKLQEGANDIERRYSANPAEYDPIPRWLLELNLEGHVRAMFAPEPTECPICREPGRADTFARGMDPEGAPSLRAIAARALEIEIANGAADLRVHLALAILSGRGRDDRLEPIYREIVGADGVRDDVDRTLAVAQAGIRESVLRVDRAANMVERHSPLADNVSSSEVSAAIEYHGTPAPTGRPPTGEAERAAYDAGQRRSEQHAATLAGLSGSVASENSDSTMRSRAKNKQPKR